MTQFCMSVILNKIWFLIIFLIKNPSKRTRTVIILSSYIGNKDFKTWMEISKWYIYTKHDLKCELEFVI